MLATNYRVGLTECTVLEILTPEGRGEIISAALDIPTYLESLKKNAAIGGTNT